jgi:hypothetical protein
MRKKYWQVSPVADLSGKRKWPKLYCARIKVRRHANITGRFGGREYFLGHAEQSPLRR